MGKLERKDLDSTDEEDEIEFMSGFVMKTPLLKPLDNHQLSHPAGSPSIFSSPSWFSSRISVNPLHHTHHSGLASDGTLLPPPQGTPGFRFPSPHLNGLATLGTPTFTLPSPQVTLSTNISASEIGALATKIVEGTTEAGRIRMMSDSNTRMGDEHSSSSILTVKSLLGSTIHPFEDEKVHEIHNSDLREPPPMFYMSAQFCDSDPTESEDEEESYDETDEEKMGNGEIEELIETELAGKGSSCHQCKSRRTHSQLSFCCRMFYRKRDNSRKQVCKKKYCDQCLIKFYDEQPPDIRHHPSNEWDCLACRYLCSCAACRRHRDNNPKVSSKSFRKAFLKPKLVTLSPCSSMAYGIVFFGEFQDSEKNFKLDMKMCTSTFKNLRKLRMKKALAKSSDE